MQFLQCAIFILPCCTTGTILSGFSYACQKPAKRRQLHRPTITALSGAVSSRLHWPTSSNKLIGGPHPCLKSHRCCQVALALAAIDATPAANDNDKSNDPKDKNTTSVPKWVPLSEEFEGESFYVRKCYDAYYRQIMDLLKTKRYISVTGTPGIGKSMFYLYFFQRYRKEFPDKSLVAASFTKTQKLIRCELFPHDSSEPLFCPVIPSPRSPDWPADCDCDLFLYDGPPEGRPDLVKMIAFTSPNFSWLDSMDNDKTHARVYMPVWDLEELLMAVDALNLDISKEELKRRFDFFGGSARYCLPADADANFFLDRGREQIKEALSKITDAQQIDDFFNGTLDPNKVVHRLMHYKPVKNNLFAELFLASDEIEKMVWERIDNIVFQERRKLMHWLEGAGQASTFYGRFFENHVHKVLLKGGDFEIRSLLPGNSTLHPLQLHETVGQYERFNSKNLSAKDATLNVYRIPESKTQASIDSFMPTESGFLVFQITIQSTHAIKADGLVDMLSRLEMLNAVKEHPELVKLIFVVREGMGARFKEQKIKNMESRNGLEKSPIIIVNGISDVTIKKLAEHSIFTCKDLITAHDNNDACVKSVKKKIAAFKSRVETTGQLDFLTLIPQYVLEISHTIDKK